MELPGILSKLWREGALFPPLPDPAATPSSPAAADAAYRTQLVRSGFEKIAAPRGPEWTRQSPWQFSPLALLGIAGCGSESQETQDGGTPPDAGGGGPLAFCHEKHPGSGNGTSASPFTFKVLVFVEKTTQQSSEALGWNIAEGVSRHLQKLNEAFNNGQLPYHFEFVSLGIQYPTLEPSIVGGSAPFNIHLTPEPEDILLIYDGRITGAGNYFPYDHTVLIRDPNAFDPARDFQMHITHEFGHSRAAIDNYWLTVLPENNQVFPGAGYSWPGKSYMGSGISQDKTWDPLSVELFRESAGDPQIDFECASAFLPGWAPANISIQVKDGSGQAVSNAKLDIYRIPYARFNYNHVWEDQLWYSGSTDILGTLKLPAGITSSSSGFFSLFLGAVHFNGESYLNWYNVLDVAVPYRQGVNDLVLNAKADDSTLYKAPVKVQTDLSLDNLAFTPASVKAGQLISIKPTIGNVGPDAYVGTLGLQCYLSTDTAWDGSDQPAGGQTIPVSLNPGKTATPNFNSTVSATLAPGAYYLICKATVQLIGATDPNTDNNLKASATTLMVTAP